jgi:transposase
MKTRKPYPSDLTEDQWNLIAGFFPERRPGLVGRPRENSFREIVNAILYLLRTGCQWRHLPHDFPVYTSVSDYYHLWRKNGLLERIHDALRTQVRKQAGKEAEPSLLLIDSQSVKTTEKGGRMNLKKLSALTRANSSKDANAISA